MRKLLYRTGMFASKVKDKPQLISFPVLKTLLDVLQFRAVHLLMPIFSMWNVSSFNFSPRENASLFWVSRALDEGKEGEGEVPCKNPQQTKTATSLVLMVSFQKGDDPPPLISHGN